MSVVRLFDPALLTRRDHPALEFRGRRFTFGQLERRSNQLAHMLTSEGMENGDRLAVHLANRPELVDLYLACAKLGVIFLPINILYREREIRHIVSDAKPQLAIASGEIPGVPTLDVESLEERIAPLSDERPEGVVDGDDPAAIVYTSGTTGASKGVVLTHNNFAANTVNLLACWQITREDRLLLPLPLFHVHGLGNGLHTWLASGCRMRLLERFDRNDAEREMLDFRPTLFFGVPTVYVRLLEIEPGAAREIGAAMRLFVSGSAPLAPEVFERFRERFGHAILERYGMTETLMCLSNPLTGERRAGTVGFPLPGVSARILDDAGQSVAPGETGVLEVHGPNVFPRYWNREDATRGSFRDGWFITGDLASRSEDGYYTLHGRTSELIVSGGFKIYPREVEELLESMDGVREAALVGIPDEARGQLPVAFVATDEGFDPEQAEKILREQLASFKVPRRWFRVERLPRNALGKVQKHLLRAEQEPETSGESPWP